MTAIGRSRLMNRTFFYTIVVLSIFIIYSTMNDRLTTKITNYNY